MIYSSRDTHSKTAFQVSCSESVSMSHRISSVRNASTFLLRISFGACKNVNLHTELVKILHQNISEKKSLIIFSSMANDNQVSKNALFYGNLTGEHTVLMMLGKHNALYPSQEHVLDVCQL